ncbi:MAG: hypothetical protein RMJ37_04025 [Spirochaetia bacterium]|nr:hypothetical protein [Spirochaetota bacterium]MDW8112494.1 hypothetical protein [Spirochaetia bacterium]
MDFFITNLLDASLITLSLSLSLISIFFSIYLWLRQYLLGNLDNKILLLCLLHTFIFISSSMLLVSQLKILKTEITTVTNVLLMSLLTLVLYENFKNFEGKPLLKRIEILTILILTFITLYPFNDILATLVILVVFVVAIYQVVRFYILKPKSENVINILVVLSVVAGTISNRLLFPEDTIIILSGLVVSLHGVVLIFLVFLENYKSLSNTDIEVRNQIEKISSSGSRITNFIDKIKSYRNSQSKLTFLISADSKKLYNYSRYFENVISEAKDSISKIKFNFTKNSQELTYMDEVLSSISETIQGVKSIQNDVIKELRDITIKTDSIINTFKVLSEDINTLLSYIKSIQEFLSEISNLVNDSIDLLARIGNAIYLFEQISIEGEMVSKNNDVTSMWQSFRRIKNLSKEIVIDINQFKRNLTLISINNNINTDKLKKLEKDVYDLLSLSDSVVNTVSNILSDLRKLQELVEESMRLNLTYSYSVKSYLDSIKSSSEDSKIMLEKEFSEIDDGISTLNTIVSKISDITKSINTISDLTSLIDQNLNSIRETLKVIERDIYVILE